MEASIEFKNYTILYVDDEENSLKYFKKNFCSDHEILTAKNAQEGYELLLENRDRIGILITDQRMPGEPGTKLLEKSRKIAPRIIRFLVTAYSDLDAAIDAVNSGAVYKYIAKPWDVSELRITLKRAMEFFVLQKERDSLLKEKVSALQKILISDRLISLCLLSSGLNHHIRNAMFSINAFLNFWIPKMVKENNIDMAALGSNDFWSDFTPKVQDQSDKILKLLTGLKEVSMQSFVFPEEVSLYHAVTKAIDLKKSELQAQKIVIENKIPESLPLLKVDKGKFDQLFGLLLEDEIHAMPDGGTVTFSAHLTEENECDSPEIEIEVRDDSSGYNQPDTLVVDPLHIQDRNNNELGFNLMACYFIVYHHGGRIVASQSSGATDGMVFTITIPLNPAQVDPMANDPETLLRTVDNDNIWEVLSDLQG